MNALLPVEEEQRLQVLYDYGLLDTDPEKAFDDIARMASRICGTPIATVSLLDHERQWFKARVGLDSQEIPREISFCAHTILQKDLLEVPDATLDARFWDNPFVCNAPHVRFYAGMPLIAPSGSALGTLCVADYFPRTLSEEQRETLEYLSCAVVTQMELRKLSTQQTRNSQAYGADARQEHRLQTVMDNVPVMIARVDTDERYVFANRAYADLLGVPPDGMIGRTIFDVVGAGAYETLRPSVERALAGEQVRFDSWIDFRTVGPRVMAVSYTPEFGVDAGVTGFAVSAMDITERRQAEDALRERTEVLSSVLAAIPHSVFWKDRDSVYLGCNPNFAASAQLNAPEDIVGKTDYDLPWALESAEAVRQEDRRVMEANEGIIMQRKTCLRADGTRGVGLTSKLPLHDAEGLITGVLGITQDVSEHRALEAERERLLSEMEVLLTEAEARADRDPLTGLLNHRAFHKKLEEEADRAAREGTPLAVAIMDLDNFKFFNDAYGHLAGDDVLRRVAEHLRLYCRPDDTLARFGGDEFILLLPGLKIDAAEALVRRLVASLDGRGYVPPGHDAPVPLRLSAGVAVFPDKTVSRLDALAVAEARLRLAKTGGGQDAALRVRTEMSGKVEGFSMLDALVAAVDNKDRYTRHHSEDVLSYSLQIAERLGLDEKTRRTIAIAALLHDVGKIGVPDAILRKPGRLTEDEFEAMRQHPMMGAVMVGAVPGFEDTLDAVRHHHERWDGGGYPFGLRGEETPLIARLMAVADAFSAMTTDRPYRKGMPQDKALAVLAEGAGSQWDPVCVSAFLHERQSY